MSGQRHSIVIDVSADISNVRSAMVELQKIFNTQNLGAGQSSKITSMFSDLSKALDELETKSGKTFSSLGEIKGLDKIKDRVSSLIVDIAHEFTKIQGIGDTELGKNFKGLSDNLVKAGEAFKIYENATSKIKKRQGELNSYIKTTSEEFKKQKDAQKDYKEFRKDFLSKNPGASNRIQQSGIRSTLESQLKQATEERNRAEQELRNYIKEKGYGDEAILTSGARKGEVRRRESYSDDETLKKLAASAKEAQKELDNCNKSLESFNKITEGLKSDDEITKIGNSIKQAKEELQNLTGEEAFNNLKTSLGKIFGEDLFKDIQNSENAVEQFKEKIGSISVDKLEALREQFPEINSLLEMMEINAQKAGQKINEGFSKLHNAAEMEKEIGALGYRLKYFFSLAGGFNLMRRAIRSAVTTTKELDAVMTQTAVVSDYTVGDMWKTLPKYSKEAKKLGAAIKEVYSAQTLYVQQGLDMNSAMDLGVETLKMARVAGISAEEATNSMTAALRGFNMELNESSAVRINDVYSKLAQNTASNVQEISTAMTKTAALANSANMSFENTAAFLATIIESTREGAETAGTALKTVIARFTEVKKLYSEGELTGTDEEGQEVDVNKISKALRTAGINMNEFFTGAKGLDEIFMELGSKWNSLTTVQQRYIATMAAGSRQQSRFLALMQNYSRTVELTSMAYNSAGSGQEQFEKTLDSLDAKLNQLKDSWDVFIMGIANSDIIKGVIDTGTGFLDIINKIVDGISGSNGLVKSIASIGLAIGGFKIGRMLISGGSIFGSILAGKGKDLGKNFGNTFNKGFAYSLTKQGRAEGYDLKNWAYQQFKFNKTSLLDGITKDNAEKVANAYKEYSGKIEGINSKRQAQENSSREQQGKLDQEEIQAKKDFQEKSGLTEKQAQAVIDNKGISQATKDYSALGNSILAAGMAAVALGTACDMIFGKATAVGGALKSLGSGAMIAGVTLKGAAAAAELFSTSVATGLGAVGVAIGAIVAIVGIVDALTESSEEKTERLRQQMEESQQYLDDLNNKYNQLNSSIDAISDKQNAFDGLVQGTKEWNDAVQDLNNNVKSLIKDFPELAKYIKFDEYGRMYFEQEDIEAVKQGYEENISLAKSATIANNLSYKRQLLNTRKEAALKSIEGQPLTQAAALYQSTHKLSDRYKEKEDFLTLVGKNDRKIFGEILTKIEDGIYNFSKATAGEIENILTGEERKFYENNKKTYAKYLQAYSKVIEIENEDKEAFSQEMAESKIEMLDSYFGQESGEVKTAALSGMDRMDKKYQELYDEIEANYKKNKGSYNEEYAKAHGYTYNGRKFLDSKGKEIENQPTKEDIITFQAVNQTRDWLKEASSYSSEWLKGQNRKVKDFISGAGSRNLKAYWDSNDNLLFNADEVARQREQAFNQIDEQLLDSLGVSDDIVKKTDILLQNNKEKIEGLVEGLVPKFAQESNFTKSAVKFMADLITPDKQEQETKKLYAEDFGGLDRLNYSKLATFISEASMNYGKTKANNLYNDFARVFKNIGDEEQQNKLISTLFDKVDWSTITSFKDLQIVLSQLGAGIDTATDGFEDLINKIIDTQKVLKTFNLNTLKEEASKILGLKDTIKSSNTSTFDEETYKKIIASGISPQKFVYTGQGYTYIGESLENLGNKVGEYLITAAKNTSQNLQYQIAEGNKINEGKTSGKEVPDGFFQGKLTKDNIDDIKNGFGNLGISKLYNKAIGDFIPIVNLADDALVSLYQDYLTFANDIEGLKAQKESVDAYAPYWGKNNDQVRAEGGSPEAQIAAAKLDAEKAGFSPQDLDAYAATFAEIEGLSKELAYAIAYDAMLMNKGFTDLQNNFSALEETLSSMPEDPALRTLEQVQAVAQLTGIIKDLTGATGELDSKLLITEETLALLKRIAEGDTSAIAELSKTLAKNLVKSLADSAEESSDAQSKLRGLAKLLEDFDDSTAKVGDNLDPGIESAIDGLLRMGAISKETAAQLFELMGYEPPEFEDQEINYDVNTPELSFGEIEGTGETTGTLTGEAAGSGIMAGETGSVSGTTTGKTIASAPVLTTKGAHIAQGSHATKKAGSSNLTTPKKGGGGGGGKKFKNDFDKYYNQVEDINELERQRNLLEKEYQLLLKNENKSGEEIYNNLKKQIDLLKQRQGLVVDLAEKRKQQLFDAMQDEEYKTVWKYAKWNDEDQTIEIDWDAINKIKNSKEGDLVKEYVQKLEDLQKKYDEMIDEDKQIEEAYQELLKRGKEQYQTLEDRTRDALIKQIQDKIDELTAVNEAINNTNQKLFDKISEVLELQRQDRENKKTEEELSDKEKRLAYLRQDSSNANQVEIAQLEKELDEARENYTDTLIDQKISELQRQNDEAAEQRDHQIELMEKSLDWQEKSGMFWNEVYRLIYDGTTATAQLLHGSELETLLKKEENWSGLSQVGQMNWLSDLNDLVAQGMAYISLNRQLEQIGTAAGTEITFINRNGETLTGTTDEEGNVIVTNADGSTTTYKEVFQDYSGNYRSLEKNPITENKQEEENPPNQDEGTWSRTSNYKYSYNGNGTHKRTWTETNSATGETKKAYDIKGCVVDFFTKKCDYCKHYFGTTQEEKSNDELSEEEKKKRRDNIKTYATGGLNTRTGPAWLDGTKSHPELVLNARDTENFIELKDTLTALRSGGGFSLAGGENYYDIDIQVDSLGSDYDVDRMVDRIKARIAQDNAYRNVNTLSRLR